MDTSRFTNDLLILLLLGSSNVMPIVARHLLGKRLNTPIDLNITFFDRMPVFGPHKTWRGVIASLLGTSIFSWLIGMTPRIGFLISLFSMTGDLASSFIKRRLKLRSGARATGLDQGLEALLPLILMRNSLQLNWMDCLLITTLFVFLDIILSPIFFRLGFRQNPH